MTPDKKTVATAYVCPKTRKPLFVGPEGLTSEGGGSYPVLDSVPNFLPAYSLGDLNQINQAMYNQPFSVVRYRNELDWLYATFGEEEDVFRRKNLERLRLQPGHKVLITGCGLGSDVRAIAETVGPEGSVYAQDLAPEMVFATRSKELPFGTKNIHFSISDAQNLPFPDGFFDGVFHFGGINLFQDVEASIKEMARVTKSGGRVVFGDESVAPWLRDTDYGRAAIFNNSLWKVQTPIHLLPANAVDVNLSWVFGNCFYLISFEVSDSGPFMDMDVPHIGARGGCMRTRYFGQLEGVSAATKSFVIESAKKKGVSVVQWLEEAIAATRGK